MNKNAKLKKDILRPNYKGSLKNPVVKSVVRHENKVISKKEKALRNIE